jgi:hypothetical protein
MTSSVKISMPQLVWWMTNHSPVPCSLWEIASGFVAQPGYVWLDMPGKVRHLGEHELEFR